MSRRSASVDAPSRLIDCDGDMLHVRTWPGTSERTIVIWHGITGTSLDHVELAEALSAEGFRVVAPDSPGCGHSEWSRSPKRGYSLTALAAVARTMMSALDITRLSWIGVSKGGGLGMLLAAAMPHRFDALILCDVGPGLPEAFRGALARRLASPPRFADIAAFRAHVLRMMERDRLDLAEATIDRLTIAWSRRLATGDVGYHYDPALAQQMLHCPEDFDLWPQWDRISCPTLVLRGERSAVLPEEDCAAMLLRNAAAQGHVLEGAGHLNFLDDPALHSRLIDFLGGSR